MYGAVARDDARPHVEQSCSRARAVIASVSALALLAAGGWQARAGAWTRDEATSALASSANASSALVVNASSSTGTSLSNKEVLRYLEVAKSDDVKIDCAIRNALCSDAVCTLNKDKLTASCGCLSMDRDPDNAGELALGWASFILAKSALYQQALLDVSDTGSVETATQDALCDAIEDGSIWTDLATGASSAGGGKGWGGKVAAVSLWSEDTYFDENDPDGGGVTCSDAMCTGCMGAPCFQIAYDGVYDLTCICPVVGFGATCGFAKAEDNEDGDLCTEISADMASCAASASGFSDEKTWDELESYVAAIIDADPRGGNSAQCPSPGVDWYEHEAGASRLNATSNAAELNVSHVLPHNSTRSRGDHNVSNRTR